MPKKKTKKGGKTEEQRVEQQLMRVQAEEEVKKKREETLTLFLKDKVQKEQKNSAVNVLKLNEGWRNILRQNREADLHTEVEVQKQNFEWQLDQKDSVVQKVLQELQEAELQAVQRSHLQHLERLKNLQEKHMKILQQQWEDGLKTLMSRFCSDRQQLHTECRQQQVKLDVLITSSQQRHDEEMRRIHTFYQDGLAWLASAHQDQMASLANEMQLHDCSAPQHQHSRTSDQKQDVKDGLSRTLTALRDKRCRLSAKMAAVQSDSESQEEDMATFKKEAELKHLLLQDWLRHARTVAWKQLSQLSVQGDGATKRLQEVITKQEKFLHLAELCHKLDTKDQVMTSSTPTTSSIITEEQQRLPVVHLSATLLQQEVMRQQRDALTNQNERLLFLLQQHQMDGVLEGQTSPLDVTPAPTNQNPPFAGGTRHNVIEAVHAAKYTL